MFPGIGAIAGIVRVKDEQGVFAVEPAAGGLIQTANRELHLPAEGIVAGEQAKEQHREAELVAAGAWLGGPQQHFRCHESRGAEHAARALAIHFNVVVVADQDRAIRGPQEQIPQGDVLVTEPLEVQFMEGVGQQEAGPEHVLQADL